MLKILAIHDGRMNFLSTFDNSFFDTRLCSKNRLAIRDNPAFRDITILTRKARLWNESSDGSFISDVNFPLIGSKTISPYAYSLKFRNKATFHPKIKYREVQITTMIIKVFTEYTIFPSIYCLCPVEIDSIFFTNFT